MASSSTYLDRDDETDVLVEDSIGHSSARLIQAIEDSDDEEFGGTEMRMELEQRLLLKLDTRMSVLVLIYILNYVCRLFISFRSSIRLRVR